MVPARRGWMKGDTHGIAVGGPGAPGWHVLVGRGKVGWEVGNAYPCDPT